MKRGGDGSNCFSVMFPPLLGGGATHFDKLLVHSPWQFIKTTRIYVNQRLLVLAKLHRKDHYQTSLITISTIYHQSLAETSPGIFNGGAKWKKHHKKDRKNLGDACGVGLLCGRPNVPGVSKNLVPFDLGAS